MNYIRGAVNAISAPYQYYKDLPPINPSTLTGAIDVIVIQRPTDKGDTELVCSPFHVRFGKWQVLRPGEKKVNVFVNGNPIPFNMKIGEAGEAFFVFETDDDVPADLITSPILQPTIPGKEDEAKPLEAPVDADRFGAKPDEDRHEQKKAKKDLKKDGAHPVEPDLFNLDGDATEEAPTTPKQKHNVPKLIRRSSSRATISQSSLPSLPPSREHSVPRQDVSEQDQRVDAALDALKAQAHVPEVEYHHDITLDMEGYKSGFHDRERSDATLRSSKADSVQQFEFPKKQPSHPQPSSSSQQPQQASPVLPHTQSALHTTNAFSRTSSPSSSPPSSSSPSPSPSPSTSTHPHPFRATSEPPPEIEPPHDDAQILTIPHGHQSRPQLQLHAQGAVEYSWEWGAFPQPSPMKASFGKGGRIEPLLQKQDTWDAGSAGTSGTSANASATGSSKIRGSGMSERKGRLMSMALPPTVTANSTTMPRDEEYARTSGAVGRSRSVPPVSLDSPPGLGRRGSREYKEYEDAEPQDEEEQDERGRGQIWDGRVGDGARTNGGVEESQSSSPGFGAGGTLSASRNDLTTLVLGIEGRKLAFQLSLVPPEDNVNVGKGGSSAVPRRARDEVETARLFDSFCIDWSRFLDDESVVHDPRLVIRWTGDQYITRHDGSPLMDALVHWRASALQKREAGEALRPVSPPPMVEQHDAEDERERDAQQVQEQKGRARSKSEVQSESDQGQKSAGKGVDAASQGQTATKKPTSSSWVQWWSRSRRNDAAVAAGSEANAYPVLEPSSKDKSTASLPLPGKLPVLPAKQGKSASENAVKTGSVPTTPVQHPTNGQPIPSITLQETTPTRPAPAAPMAAAPAKRFAKTLRLTSDQLKSLNLRPGANAITFSLSSSGAIAATARIFVWDSTDLVVISDIDGTITKSDGLGHVFAMIGRDWTHLGVAKLYTDIVRNGYKIMYLTSRAIGQADATRDYLKGIKQNNYQLPEGPVIMSPDRLMTSLHREVILRKPEVFKMACLRDIQRLFGESARNPFYAGFGNRITDALSYRSVNVPSARIFTIDTAGEVKMELLELAGYKSSYIHMTDLVDQMFPPIHRKWTPEFTDFNYWKTPVQDYPLPDFSPPSPALSARSDTSNQSTLARIRNFSLGGNSNSPARQHMVRQSTASSTEGPQDDGASSPYRNSHLRQMSSFEKLSSTLGFGYDSSQRSASPSSSYIGSDDEDEEDISTDGLPRKRVRRRSMTSMPGTLDEMHFGMDDDDDMNDDRQFVHEPDNDEGGEDGYEGEGDEDGVEEEPEFDDDLLAAGEMQNVPFL